MKKQIALLLTIACMMTLLLSGCGKSAVVKAEISLSEQPVAEEQLFDLKGRDTLELTFDLPAAGRIKLLAYDATDYQEEIGEYPEGKVFYYDEAGEELYKELPISSGYLEKCSFEAGKVTAKIRFSGDTSKIEKAAVSWAYAAESEKAPALKMGEMAAVVVDDKGNAQFTVEIEKAGLYSIMPSEGCIFECDCGVEVKDSQGKKVVGNLFIHGSEWISRTVFLQKGSYIIAINNLNAVATCSIKEQETFEAIVLQGEKAEVPAVLGFSENSLGPVEATLQADESKTRLTASACGTDSYYDYEQGFNLLVKDGSGKVVLEEECEGSGSWDISKWKGKYTIVVTASGNSVVKLNVE